MLNCKCFQKAKSKKKKKGTRITSMNNQTKSNEEKKKQKPANQTNKSFVHYTYTLYCTK